MSTDIFNKIWVGKKKNQRRTSPKKTTRRKTMKTLKMDNLTYSMLEELSKKHNAKMDMMFTEMITRAFMEYKRTGKKVL